MRKLTTDNDDGCVPSEKPHPSELLEFASVIPDSLKQPKIGGSTHLEYAVDEDARTSRDVEAGALSIGNDVLRDFYSTIPDALGPSTETKRATDVEHKMTFYNGCRLYPKAMAWSFLLSCTIIMEGYDTTLINSFYAFPAFQRRYGSPVHQKDSSAETGAYQITTAWQAALSNASVASEIVGLFLNGFSTDRFGYHWTMIGALVLMVAFVFPAFFAKDIGDILASQILCGLPWGAFQTLSTTYAAEVMPVQMRAYLTSNVNMCWLVGQLLGVSVMRGLIENTTEWSYRIPFGLQWAFAILILCGLLFAPESPWWLVRHEKLAEAKRSLSRLVTTGLDGYNVDESLELMKHTNDIESYLHKESSSFLDCFKGSNLRRTEICCLVYASQTMNGSTLTGFAAYFYEQAGVDVKSSFTTAVGMYALAILGGVIAWFLLPRIGRRRLYLGGSVAIFSILITAGIIGALQPSRSTSWAVASLLILLTFVYDMTLGPVCYVLVAEVPSTRLRVKTVVLARATYNAISIAMNIGTSHMLNPAALDWRGKTCFLYAATTALSFVWCYFRLPETKGLSYLELDILFEKKASTRKFKELQTNLESSGYFSLTRNESAQSRWSGY